MIALKRYALTNIAIAVSENIRFTILSLPLLFTACHSATPKTVVTANDSVSLLLGAKPIPLSKAEAQRLYNACALWYDSALKLRGFNGGILVAKNGNIVFEAYNGNAHLNRTEPIDSLSSFHIASVSKTFTAMAVLKLWQDGKLNIDDEYSKYFPAFNYPGVTVRSLLNHRSGLPNYLYFMETLGWDKKTLIKNEDVLNYLITRKAELTNIATPNTHFTYCNTNYALLALLVEKISGTNFPNYLQQTFFLPLQMKHTFLFNSLDTSKVNPSYDWRGRQIPLGFLDGVYGDKNIYTTPRDLLKWDRALTGGKLFTPQTLEQAYAPYSNEKAGIKNYGLGWRMNIFPNGKKTIYHNGWWHGSNAAFLRLLPDSVAIIVIGNKYNSNIYHAKELANIFGNYNGKGVEEDETENTKVKEILLPVTGAPVPVKQPVSKKVVLQQKLKARNKTRKHR
jgi:CubicO group peptidase (beta-lactamase class C family)